MEVGYKFIIINVKDYMCTLHNIVTGFDNFLIILTTTNSNSSDPNITYKL